MRFGSRIFSIFPIWMMPHDRTVDEWDMQIPDTISVASLSNLQQGVALDRASFAVAKKTLDVQKSQGNAAVSLLKQAADFATGRTSTIDGYA